MIRKLKKITPILATALVSIMVLSSCGATKVDEKPVTTETKKTDTATSTEKTEPATTAPIKFTMSYSDSATLPFKKDWLAVLEAQKLTNSEVEFEIIPIKDYDQKISLALNAGNAPDVVLYQTTTKGEFAALSLNGSITPISDYSEDTPYFNQVVKDFGVEEDVDALKLKDGKLYFLPALYDQPFYDGGLIIRSDLLAKYSLKAPTTYDEFYEVLKKFKQEDPTSYPLTTLVEPRVLFRMSMPSFGISLGKNAASGSYVLSYDYEKKEYFSGATSDKYKAYLEYFAKLFKEELLDPEMINAGDAWTSKLATGKSMASFAYYDQIGGITGTSTIDGISFDLIAPLAGPDGAHHQPKGKTRQGISFPIKTSKRDDFKQLVQTVDKMFYSPEMSEIWCLGVDGVTFTKTGDKYVFNDNILNSKDGIYKSLQTTYGLGSDPLQHVWVNAREMLKYDDKYAKINAEVAAMPDAIQNIPPTVQFDDVQAEQAGIIQAPLADAFEVWTNAFITGQKSLDTDWDAYVTEMNTKQIDKLTSLYNENLPK